MSKSHISNTLSHGLQQEGGKNVQIGRSQNVLSTNLTKGVNINTLDEFKHGFPSEGLSTVSYKWWGSSNPDGYESISKDGAESCEVAKTQSIESADDGACSVSMNEEKGENEEEKINGPQGQGIGLLMAVRKRVVEEGREALKLGVLGAMVHTSWEREKKLCFTGYSNHPPCKN